MRRRRHDRRSQSRFAMNERACASTPLNLFAAAAVVPATTLSTAGRMYIKSDIVRDEDDGRSDMVHVCSTSSKSFYAHQISVQL